MHRALLLLHRALLLLAIALAVSTLAASPVPALTTQVLLTSGDVAPDGRVLGFFDAPIATRPATVAFSGTTSAVMTKSGATLALVAKTGDPLPVPLTGTFNNLFDPVINDSGAIAFRADLNSTSAESGLFLVDGGGIVPIVLFGGLAGGPVRVSNPPDVNGVNDVVYEDRGTTLFLWSQSGGISTPLVTAGDPAPGGGTFTSFGDRPVLNDSDVVAFEGEVSGGAEGIFTWDAVNGVLPVAQEGTPSPIGGTYKTSSKRTAISINASGQVAFTANISLPGLDPTVVFLYDPAGPFTTTVAQPGMLVGSETLLDIDAEYVGVDSSGTVAFEGRFATGRKLVLASGGSLTALTGPISAREFAPRLTDVGRIIWRGNSGSIERFDGSVTTVVANTDATPIGVDAFAREPSINNLDVAVFRATQSVLYRFDDGTTEVIAAPGDPSPGSGTIAGIGAFAFRGRSLALRLSESAGGSVLALKRSRGALTRVIGTGDATPIGGTFDVLDDVLDVTGQDVLFASSISGSTATSGLFRVKVNVGTVETVAKAGDPAPNGALFDFFTAVLAAGRQAVFAAHLDSGDDGIFLTSSGGPVTVAVTGDPAPDTGGGFFGSFGTIAVSGKRVLFAATIDGGAPVSGIFLWAHGTLAKVVAEGDPQPGGGGGTFGDVLSATFTPLAVNSKGAAFVSSLDGSAAFEGLFFARGGVITSMVLDGDPTPLGGAYAGLNLATPLSLAGGAIIYEASLTAASGVAYGLFSVAP